VVAQGKGVGRTASGLRHRCLGLLRTSTADRAKIPFIVPGNQLYLPDLGLDLREYFRQRSPTAQSALSPSAQAMLITALLHQPWQAEWQPSTVAVALAIRR
jgi:hypothetical protein